MSFRGDMGERWRHQAQTATSSPLYEHIATQLSEDPKVGSILEAAPVGQRLGVLMLAAVQYLLLSGVEHPLASYYPSLGGELTDDPYPAFRDFCLSYRADLERLCATRM